MITKWEYIYATANQDHVNEINGQLVGYQGLFAGRNVPPVKEFLDKMGQEGWEVVGICSVGDSLSAWRIMLKKPISD